MIYRNAEAGQSPERVKLERLPDKTIVRMTDNVRPFETAAEEGQPSQTMYRFDEVVFDLPEDRAGETVVSITTDFAAWWAFGSEDEEPVTLEDRVAALEDMFLATLEM